MKSSKTFAYCVVSGLNRTYYSNWEDRDKYDDTSNSNAPYTDKLYLNTVDGRAYHWDGSQLSLFLTDYLPRSTKRERCGIS